MPTEVPRCSECGAALKAVPSWLAGAKASFTCGACPKRSARAATLSRIDKQIEAKTSAEVDDVDNAPEDVDETDEEADLEVSAEEHDDSKDEVDV